MGAVARRLYREFSELAGDWPRIRPSLGRVVFTNGCFDILHAGHVTYLEEARALGTALVLGLNSDDSISRLKGPERPLVPFADRARVLSGLRAVDLVVGFEEDTPLELIRQIEPDVLVKGGDWRVDQIVGADFVIAHGGEVASLSLLQGRSTTDIVARIRAQKS